MIDSILDLLGQEVGHRNRPIWLYVTGAISTAIFAYSAKVQADKWRQLQSSKKTSLLNRSLSAVVVSSEEKEEMRYIGEIEAVELGFRLVVQLERDNERNTVLDETRESLQELEEFMRANTKFILADFK